MCCIELDPLCMPHARLLCNSLSGVFLPLLCMMTSVAFMCLEWSRKCSQKGLQLDATAGGATQGGTEDCLQGEMKLFHIIAVVLPVMLRVNMPVCFPVLYLAFSYVSM